MSETWHYLGDGPKHGGGRKRALVPHHVSSLGRYRIGDKIRNIRSRRQGYMIQKLPSGRTEYLHKIVAEAFLGPCPAGQVVDHVNENKLDNRADNLEYVTRPENSRRANLRKTRQKKCPVGDPDQAAKIIKKHYTVEQIETLISKLKELIAAEPEKKVESALAS